MRVGAHVSSAGGCMKVFGRAEDIGAEAIQMFISGPQSWRPPKLTEEEAAGFRARREELDIPVFFHGVYLINLAVEDEAKLNRGVGSLKQYLKWGSLMGVEGTVFHVGSHKGAGMAGCLPQVCGSISSVLDYADERGYEDHMILMENNAGQGGGIGVTFQELGSILDGLDRHPRVGICVDTCHAFAMGYDIRTKEGVERVADEIDRYVGLDRLKVVHANDSKMDLGGLRDRHENIGDGFIGPEGFVNIMSHPAFREVPFILEVPGIEDNGPDAENINRLRQARSAALGEVGTPRDS